MNDEDSQKGHDINIRIWRKGGLERQFGSNLINNSILFSNGKAGRLSQILSNPPQHVFFLGGGGEPPPIFSRGAGVPPRVFFGHFFTQQLGRGGATSHASEQFLARQSTSACLC